MREIKFRAKCLDNGEWVDGFVLFNHDKSIAVIAKLTDMESVSENVIPNTIGQFTGLHDKNGKDIFEGDIVKRERKSLRVRGFPEKTYSEVGYIGFKRNDGRYVMVTSNSECSLCEPYAVQMEVIGNIHDNPELINN